MNTTKTTPSDIHWTPCGIPIHPSTVTSTTITGSQRHPKESLHARSVERYRKKGASAGPWRSAEPAGAFMSSPEPHPA